ncbi:MAG: oligosaccharide flippase family protein [Deltaproteobacteria bacterium]|nr:oligosaccharide flippase family protein [Deltaproteobacteria bacterium]
MPPIREAGLRLAAESGLYTVGMFLVRAGNFLLLPLYLSLLDPAEYGAFGVVRQLVVALVPLAVTGQVHSLLRLVVDTEQGSSETSTSLLQTVVAWVLGSSLVLTALAAAAWPLLDGWVGGVPLWPLGLAGLGLVAGQGLFNIAQAWLQAVRRARAHTLLAVLRWLVLLGGVLLFVIGLGWGAPGLLLAMSLSFGLVAIGSLGLSLRGRPPKVHRDLMRASLVYGLPLLPHAFSTVVFGATGQLVIAADPSAGLAIAGAYLLATQLGQVVAMVAVGVQKAWVPFFLREDRDRDQRGWERVRVLSFFGLVAVALTTVAVGLLSPELVALAGLFSPHDWSAAALVVPILAFSGLLRAYYLVALTVVLANKQSARWLGAVTLPAAVLNVVLTLLWVPAHGMAGAAWAAVASWGGAAIATGFLARRARIVPFKYARAAVLLGLCGAALAAGVEQDLAVRAGVLAAFVASIALLDGRDLGKAVRSLRG